ncbi:MAG: hypothetical protein ACK5V3_00735 [Bdellovibrionales bacterium]
MVRFFFLFFYSFFSVSVFAQNLSAQNLAKTFRESGCLTQSRCLPPFSIQVIQGQQIQQLPNNISRNLAEIARSQAQIWADTILEGDFWSDGRTRLQSTKVLRHGQRVLGYYITYVERAWYLGDCRFELNQLSSLQKCLPGYITESTFVSVSGDDYRVDENQFAKFVPSN